MSGILPLVDELNWIFLIIVIYKFLITNGFYIVLKLFFPFNSEGIRKITAPH